MTERKPKSLSEEVDLFKEKVIILLTPVLSKALYLVNRALERRTK